jgi:glycosyltransferase 2 family protein
MKWQTLLKLLVSIIMLALVFRLVNFASLAHTLTTLSLSSVLLITSGYMAGQLLSALKWWRIAKAGGINVSFLTAVRAYFIGMFVNVLGVGTLGGDMARAVLLAQNDTPKAAGVASVVADRAHGLAVLAAIGMVSIGIYGIFSLEPVFGYLLAGFGLAIVLGWLIGPALVLRVFPVGHPFRLKVERILSVFPKDPRTVILITLISVSFHLLQISLHKLMGLSLGVDIPWAYLLVACPFANIVSSLPISWQGLGVRENAYRFFFVPAGVLTPEQAVAFGAIWFFSMTISGCVGGVVALATGAFGILNKKEEDIQLIEGEPVRM